MAEWGDQPCLDGCRPATGGLSTLLAVADLSEVRPQPDDDHNFDDLLASNREFARHFDQHGFDGVAHAGVLMVTCMDSRILPLEMIGLSFGDAKILRTPGGRITTSALA